MRRLLSVMVGAAVLLGGARLAASATYAIDPQHSTVSFKIRHLFSKVEGTFNAFEGTVDFVPGQPDQWRAAAVIQTGSIDTRVEQRDTHLRSADFFDAAQFPTITFTSTGVTGATDTSAVLRGRLSLHGVEHPVELQVTILGEGKDPWGNQRAGFTATTRIARTDFGITWNKALESGGVLLGDEVDITLDISGIVK